MTTVETARELLRLVREDHSDAGPICELGDTLAKAVVLESAEAKTEPGPDGFLWQLWDDYGGKEIRLQRACGCEKGLLLSPARFCPRCKGEGYIVKTFKLEQAEAK